MTRPIHPWLFAAFPILFLVAHNRDVTSPSAATVPLIVVLGAVTAAQLVIGRITAAPRKVAIVLSVVLVLFFSYGHVWTLVESDVLLGTVSVLVLVVVGLATVRARRPLTDLTRVLNIVALALTVTTVVTIGGDLARSAPAADGASDTMLEAPQRPRDIYYLVFDRYADAATLSKHFGFDNGDVIRTLESRGFVVPGRSLANYQNTHLSLASALNFDHLDNLLRNVRRPSRDLQPVFDRIARNEVAEQLKAVGYRYIHVGSWAAFTASSPLADVNLQPLGSSEFTRTLLGSTALSPLVRNATTDEDITQRDATRGALRQLDAAIEMDGPKFVFTHLILPHPPYVFDRNGRASRGAEREGNVSGYLEAVRFANREIERITAKLLDVPEERKPIIVIQADEGPYPRLTTTIPRTWTTEPAGDVRVKYGIFNAMHLPGPAGEQGSDAVYDGISSVNTFRVIFNRYFGTTLPMLDDALYATVDKRDAYTFERLEGIATAEPSPLMPPGAD